MRTFNIIYIWHLIDCFVSVQCPSCMVTPSTMPSRQDVTVAGEP